jgi:vitamin B12 transporter
MNFHVEEETMPKYYNSLLCISLLAVCTPVAAQQDDAPPTMMDEVVVTESRIEERKRDVSANITTITREDIEQSASRDLGSLLAERGTRPRPEIPG